MFRIGNMIVLMYGSKERADEAQDYILHSDTMDEVDFDVDLLKAFVASGKADRYFDSKELSEAAISDTVLVELFRWAEELDGNTVSELYAELYEFYVTMGHVENNPQLSRQSLVREYATKWFTEPESASGAKISELAKLLHLPAPLLERLIAQAYVDRKASLDAIL